MRRLLAPLVAVLLLGAPAITSASIDDCPQAVKDVRGTQPTSAQIATAINTAADAHDVPAVLLRAIAYVESGWRQYNTDGTVLASTDAVCGLGIMQVTADDYSAEDQVRLADDYAFNVDQGAEILAAKWATSQTTPPPTGAAPDDKSVIENWFYALCLYNGCGSDPTYPTKVANVVADPFRYAPNFTPLKAYWFTKPQDAKPDYTFPSAFQARYSPEQQFVFYDHTTGTPTSVVAAPTHDLDITPAPPSEYGSARYGPNDTRTTCAQCGGWRLAPDAGINGRAHWTNSVTGAAQATMTWRPVLTGTGRYRVQAYVPALGAETLGTATYQVGATTVTIDQNTTKNAWRWLGDHTLDNGDTVTLLDSSSVGGQKLVGDALQVSAVPTMTVTAAPASVTYTGASTLTIKLTHAGAEYRDEPYQADLYKRAAGTSGWAYVGRYPLGDLKVVVRPTVNAEYQARSVSPYRYMTPVSSAVRRVNVATKVTARLADATVARNASASVSVTVSPSHAGQQVVLQRLVNGVWQNSLGKTLSGSSTATFTFSKSTAGTYTYRAYKPADSHHVAGYSAAVKLYVS